MYELGNEWREFAGDSRDEAVSKAVAYFRVEAADSLKITEVPSGTVSGLGGRTVVVAIPTTAKPPQRSEARGDRDDSREERPRRGREESRDNRRERSPRPRRERGGRDRDGDRDRGDRGRDRDRGDRERNFESRGVEAIQHRELGQGTAKTELSEVGEFVKGLLERMRLGNFEIGESIDGDKLIALEIGGDIAEGLGRGGDRAAEAVQLLANQAAMRIGGGEGPRVVVDVEGEQAKREELLERVADRAGRRAKTTGRPVALEAMNSKDRRTIHVVLREMEGIATMSVGEGRYRQVVVVPESAPEYEEARNYQSESSSD